MKLSELSPKKGSKQKRKRRGRGTGSGHGKTSCRGHKGQKSRSGNKTRYALEGGQMPLARRVPKRGFTSKFKKVFQVINVQDLNKFRKDSVVDLKALLESGLTKSKRLPVKVLGKGEIKKTLTVKVHNFSKSASEKLTKAGCKVETL